VASDHFETLGPVCPPDRLVNRPDSLDRLDLVVELMFVFN
jgi:hypothetical protein